jgi:hypothetical protein
MRSNRPPLILSTIRKASTNFYLPKPLLAFGYGSLLILATLGSLVADEPAAPASAPDIGPQPVTPAVPANPQTPDNSQAADNSQTPDNTQLPGNSQNPANSQAPNVPLIPQQGANLNMPFSPTSTPVPTRHQCFACAGVCTARDYRFLIGAGSRLFPSAHRAHSSGPLRP